MSGFDAGWLALREPFDAAARDRTLATRFIAAVAAHASLPGASRVRSRAPSWRPDACRIVDLAAGTGANRRVLAPQLSGHQDWLLVDHDPGLIATQADALGRWARANGWHCAVAEGGLVIDAGGAQWRVRARRLDLQGSLDQLDLASFDGVTTTAFLDLVSAAWLDRLSDRIARAALPLLATLSVDGRRDWQPASDGDAAIALAFERHQQGDKGFGASLGGAAVDGLRATLEARGYLVATARADWRIGVGSGIDVGVGDGTGEGTGDGAGDPTTRRDMLLRLIGETAAVALEVEPARAAAFEAWAMLRRSQVASGALSLLIGHQDLLALPATASG
jgi:hypothetical protein